MRTAHHRARADSNASLGSAEVGAALSSVYFFCKLRSTPGPAGSLDLDEEKRSASENFSEVDFEKHRSLILPAVRALSSTQAGALLLESLEH